MSRPEEFADLPLDKTIGPPIVTIDYSRVGELPASVLQRLYATTDAMEQMDVYPIYIDGRREDGDVVDYRRRLNSQELRASLEKARAEWDALREHYESAQIMPLCHLRLRHEIDAWARAEGRPPIDWDEALR